MKVFLVVVCLCLALITQSSVTVSAENDTIEALLMAYQYPKISEDTKAIIRNKLIDLGHVFAHDRTKRQARDGSHWCCKVEDSKDSLVLPRTKLKQEVEVREETSESCNEMRVCELVTIKVNITVYKTFQDFSEATVVPQGDEPCPESLLTCCNGFLYFQPVDNCVDFPDFRELLDIFTRFPGLGAILNPTTVIALANEGPSALS